MPRSPSPTPLTAAGPAGAVSRVRPAVLSAAALVLCVAVLFDALAGPPWLSAACVLAAVASLALAVLLAARAFGARSPATLDAARAACCIALALGGAVILPVTGWTGWTALCAGALMLAAALPRPAWALGLVVGVCLVVAFGGAAVRGADEAALLRTGLGLAGVALAAYAQRAGVIRRAQEEELARTSRRLIAEQERSAAEAARSAALEERARIARELHDVLAHALGGLVVQLDAATTQAEARVEPEAVAERLRAARALAADGLRDARAAVRELRGDDGDTVSGVRGRTVAAGPTGGRGERAIEPAGEALARIERVACGTVARQMGLELEIVGEPMPLPVGVAEALAAVLRESLTNAQKHAPGRRTVATVVFSSSPSGGARVRLDVVNATSAGAAGALALTGGGYGIAGMRARMSDAGGALDAGAPSEGRFLVQARWPAERIEEGAA